MILTLTLLVVRACEKQIRDTDINRYRLGLDRVFVSANTRNVEVFTTIAARVLFRAKITEIVWDNALLHSSLPIPGDEIDAYYASDDA